MFIFVRLLARHSSLTAIFGPGDASQHGLDRRVILNIDYDLPIAFCTHELRATRHRFDEIRGRFLIDKCGTQASGKRVNPLIDRQKCVACVVLSTGGGTPHGARVVAARTGREPEFLRLDGRALQSRSDVKTD